MPFSIFVSHAGCDRLVAEAVTRRINNAFRGSVTTYLAVRDLRPGDNWKRELRAKLQECDAILSIITRESQSRPWILIEWGAFWLQDKTSYVCLDDDVAIESLVHPMQDRQVARLRDEESIRSFFEAIADDAGFSHIPFQHAESFVEEICALLDEQTAAHRQHELAMYENPAEELPRDSERLLEIAQHFLDCRDEATFVRVAGSIRDESRLVDLCREAIDKGLVDVGLLVADRIGSSDRLFEVYSLLVDRGPGEHALLIPLLDGLGRRSQTELQRLAIRLVERGEEDSPLFSALIDALGNMAELRKVGEFLVAQGRIGEAALDAVIDKLGVRNRAELRKVGSEFIRHGLIENPAFERLRAILFEQNKKEYQKLEKELAASRS